MNNVEWGLIKAFLAVSQFGSLSAAARQLGVSQPTLSRQIQALETQMHLNLFKRTTQGLLLTKEGEALVDSANSMSKAAESFARQASGLSVELEGDIRIAANEIVGAYLLPPAIAAFRQAHPSVQIEIVISNQASSLSKREADIALRMFEPQQPDLVVRRLPDMALGFYAHKDYLAEQGTPDHIEQITGHTIIGYDHDMGFIEGAKSLGYQLQRNDFAVRTDHLLTQIGLMRSAAGIGISHVAIASRYSELVQILEEVPIPPLEFWCVCHSDVQYNSRIQAAMTFLSEWFAHDPYGKVLL